MHHRSHTIALLLLASLIAGCEENPAPLTPMDPGPEPPIVNIPLVSLHPPRQDVPAATSTNPHPLFVEPDFSLADANANSATYAQNVSPRACIGKISAWYFGAAT
jgi:hypothetical protein